MQRRKRKNLGGIPLISLPDVAFLLLIFFLTTTTFDIKTGLGLVLPPASEHAEERVRLRDENITRIWINQQGIISLDEEPVSPEELESQVRRIIAQNPEMVFSLRTHRQSRYDNMISALDRLRAAGAERISLSTN